MKHYRFFDLIMAVFVTVLVVSNIASSAKIVDWGVSLFGVRMAFDAGTILFPISYIFGDILTEVYGYKRSRRVIWSGFGATALMAFFIWLAGVLPGEVFWQQTVGQDAFNAVLGGVSGLVVASLVAYFMGEFSNSYVLARMKILTKGRWVWSRTIGSTLVGEAIDTVVFFTIATALGVFPPEIVVSLMVTNYILKVGIEVILTPLTLQVIRWLKR